MMNLQKYLKTSSIYILIIFFLFSFEACKKEVPGKKYIAKVNDSYLTEDELDSIYNVNSGIQYKDEIIRNWINRELLFQEARKQGILNSRNFNRILDDSKKELAASFLIKNFVDKEKISVNSAELEGFYNNNPDEFKLIYNSYLLNIIVFSNEDDALKFRAEALGKNWNDAYRDIKNDTAVCSEKSSELLFEYKVQPISVLRVVRELYPSEISIVLHTDEGKFTVVQLIQKFDKGEIPPFDLVKDEIKNLYLVKKKELTVKNYIKELYSKNDIEVNN
ncbi:MAG: peptidyl-prolyl cis-trans isomerase [Ignavibacteriaceae bacterium]